MKIFTVGLGDSGEGARIPVRDASGNLEYVKEEGKEHWSKTDQGVLQKIATATGGAHIPAGTRAYDLGQIYEDHLAGLARGDDGAGVETQTLPRAISDLPGVGHDAVDGGDADSRVSATARRARLGRTRRFVIDEIPCKHGLRTATIACVAPRQSFRAGAGADVRRSDGMRLAGAGGLAARPARSAKGSRPFAAAISRRPAKRLPKPTSRCPTSRGSPLIAAAFTPPRERTTRRPSNSLRRPRPPIAAWPPPPTTISDVWPLPRRRPASASIPKRRRRRFARKGSKRCCKRPAISAIA